MTARKSQVNDSVNNELPHNNSINLGTGFLRIGSHNAVVSTSDARWNVAYRVVCQFSFATSEMISFARYRNILMKLFHQSFFPFVQSFSKICIEIIYI